MANWPSAGATIKTLMHRLNSPDAGSAWAEFVDRYSPLIMGVVRQFEFQHDRADECFLYVCEHLVDKGFRRLLRFDTSGRANFKTWLGSVVYNLCVDWHRKEYGRAQLLPAVTALPLLEQSIYKLYFEQHMDREACFQTLRDEFPDLSRARFFEAIACVHRVLTPRQRWQLGVLRQRKRGHDGTPGEIERVAVEPEAPETQAEVMQRTEKIEQALACLSSEERLILQLRYVEGLPLREIADLLQLGDAFRVRRKVQKALDAMYRALPARSLTDI